MNGDSKRPVTFADLHDTEARLNRRFDQIEQRFDTLEKLVRHVVEVLPTKADQAEVDRLRSIVEFERGDLA